MDRIREARRSNMAATNGLSRRRQRSSSLRDTHEEDEQMELQDTVRLRDRANKRDRDRDRDRDREKYRDREFSNHKIQNKRRRGDSLNQGNHREEGEDESTEESVADEEEYEIEERRVAHAISHNNTSFSSALSIQNTRKTVPPTKLARQAPALKAADEMIGVLVPRKARSASVKRSHENWVSGNGGFWEDRKASTSPASRSVEANSPSSSNVSVRKKMKPNGPKTRLPKVAKSSSSVQQEDIEIEIAEVLFGLKKQSQNSKKEDDSVGNTVQNLESKDANSINQETKPSVSVLPEKASSADPSHGVGVPKKEEVEVDNSSNLVQISSVASSLKFEGELPAKTEISAPKSEKTSQLIMESCEVPHEMDASKVASVMVESPEELGPGCPSGSVTEKKSVSAGEESASCCKMDVDYQDSTVTKASSTLTDSESRKVEKFKIDLMAPPPMAHETDSFNDFASDPPIKAQDVNLKSLVKDEEKADRLVKKESSVEEVEEPIEEKRKVKFDLEKPNQDNGRDCTIKSQQQIHKQEQPPTSTVPKVEKTGQSTSVPLQVAVAGWPNGLPPLGYMPPYQTIMPVDGSARSVTTQQPPPQFMLSQPRPKRCATHHYIARNVYLNQQFAKMNHFWPAGAVSTSLGGAKSNNLNVVPSTETVIHGNHLQGNLPVVNLNSVQERGQATSNFPGLTQKDKISEGVNCMDQAQRKQIGLQQAPQPPASSFLPAPAFIYPVSQQQAVLTAAANQSGPKKSTSTKSASLSGNSTAAISASSTGLPQVATAVGYNYPNLAANEAPYMTIVHNNGYPFPVPTPIGTPPAIRATHAQALPFFNGSFYPSQIFHSSQLQQQQQPHSQPLMQATYQNTSTSSASSSSHKQPQSQQPRGAPVSNNSLSSSTSMLPLQPQRQHVSSSTQNRKLETEISGENAASHSDSRVSSSQTNIYGQNFSVPLQALNFALMPSPIVGGGGIGGNHNEKQQQSQQKSLKGGVELIPPQAFAMSFASSFGGNNTAPNVNFSSMLQNSAIFQSLPDMARQGYQVAPAPQAALQKNHQISEVKTGGGPSNHDDGKKTAFGKSPTSNGQTLVFDNSARTLNFVSSPISGNWPSRSITSSTVSANAPNASSSQNFQQQQLLQLQKQQMLQQQQQSAVAARSKAPTTNNLSSSTTLVQSNSSSQSPHWKNSARTAACQVPPTSLASSNSATIKNVSQQQVRSQQVHTQISFERNSKSGLAPQVQQITTSNQSPSPLVVGSPPSGGNLRTSSTGSKAGSSMPALQSQQTENSSASTGQKSSPVCGRNVPSILSTCPSHLSELKY